MASFAVEAKAKSDRIVLSENGGNLSLVSEESDNQS